MFLSISQRGARMDRQEGLIEAAARVLAPRGVGAGAKPPPRRERILVLPARPHREADARGRQVLGGALERQAVDVDDPLVRRTADVSVGGQGEASVQVPAPSSADLGQEAPHVGGDVRGHTAG